MLIKYLFLLVNLTSNLLSTQSEESHEVNEVDDDFDPVEEMRRLLEDEIAEGEAFKQKLRNDGVNVEEWEEKLDNFEFDNDDKISTNNINYTKHLELR